MRRALKYFAALSLSVIVPADTVTSGQALGHFLKDQVAVAKRRGDKAITIKAFFDEEAVDAEQLLTASSVVLLTYDGASAGITVVGDSIDTWRLFRLEEMVAQRAGYLPCGPPIYKPTGTVPKSMLAIPILGGPANIDGVEVTQIVMRQVALSAGQRYVGFVSLCGDGTARMSHTSGLWPVSPEGRILANSAAPPAIAREFAKNIGTVRQLRERLSQRR